MPQYHHLARLPGCLLLRRSLSLCAALLAACGGGSASSDTPPLDASVAFAATDLDFPNPERGMTRSLGPLASVSDNQLAALSADGVRLAYAPLRLDPWRDASLPDNLLTQLEERASNQPDQFDLFAPAPLDDDAGARGTPDDRQRTSSAARHDAGSGTRGLLTRLAGVDPATVELGSQRPLFMEVPMGEIVNEGLSSLGGKDAGRRGAP